MLTAFGSALEGQLFRGVVEDAAERGGVRCTLWCERDLLSVATTALNLPEKELRDIVTALGRDIDGPCAPNTRRRRSRRGSSSRHGSGQPNADR